MKIVISGVLAILLSSCVGYREKQVEFVSETELSAREARAQCRAMARTLIQIARCDGR